MVNFGEKIYQLRRENGLSQEELAYKLRVSRQTISNWENGSAQPALDKAATLSALLNVSLNELAGLSVENKKVS